METNSPAVKDSGNISPQLRSLLSLSFTCIKGLVLEEKALRTGFEALAKDIKTVETSSEIEKIRTQYRRLLVLMDDVEEKKLNSKNNTGNKKSYDSLEKKDDKTAIYPKLLAIFAQGTRHLCDKGDLLVEVLLEIEKGRFIFTDEKVDELVASLKNFFLGKLNEIETATKERNELKTIINALSTTLESFSSENSTYGIHLREYSARINHAVTLDDIVTVKKSILLDTEKIVAESETFRSKVSNAEDNLKKAGKRIKKLEEEIEKVKEASAIDPLTEIYNRGYFNRKLQETVDYFSRYGGKTSFVMLDIDHFKKFNDTYGHQVGDKVLKTVAALIKKNCRKTDFLFRYGGEEFAAILPNTNLKDGKEVAELLKIGVQKHSFKYKGEKVSVTISLGLTLFKQGDSMAKVIERADKALYQAKANGRNRVEVMY